MYNYLKIKIYLFIIKNEKSIIRLISISIYFFICDILISPETTSLSPGQLGEGSQPPKRDPSTDPYTEEYRAANTRKEYSKVSGSVEIVRKESTTETGIGCSTVCTRIRQSLGDLKLPAAYDECDSVCGPNHRKIADGIEAGVKKTIDEKLPKDSFLGWLLNDQDSASK